MAYGCLIAATEAAFGLQGGMCRTGATRRTPLRTSPSAPDTKAARSGVQADELRVKTQGSIVCEPVRVVRRTRSWGATRPTTCDTALIRRLAALIRAYASRCLLLAPDTTFRARLVVLAWRSRGMVRCYVWPRAGMYLVGTVYGSCACSPFSEG